MKIYCFVIMLLFTSATGFGQGFGRGPQAEKERSEREMAKNKADKAAIDKFLSDPKNSNDAAAYFNKGKLYLAVAGDTFVLTHPTDGNSSADSTESLKLNSEAFEALKKYQQLDPKELLLIVEDHGSFFSMYNLFFNIGGREFQRKNYSLALEGFKNSLAVEEFIVARNYDYGGFKFPAFDDRLIRNLAVAAKRAKGEAAAVPYYRRLADANVSGEPNLSVYQFLIEYYLKQNDGTNLAEILKKGRTLYPQNNYWVDVELDFVVKTGNKAAIMAKYEELIKRYPANYAYPYNLSAELYNQLYLSPNPSADAIALKDKLTATLKLAIPLDKGVDSKMMMARHLYNYAWDLMAASNAIKGVTPENVKKRNDLKDQFTKKVSECTVYGEGAAAYFAAAPKLNFVQKANYKLVLDILRQIYNIKGDQKKAADYAKKIADLDKL